MNIKYKKYRILKKKLLKKLFSLFDINRFLFLLFDINFIAKKILFSLFNINYFLFILFNFKYRERRILYDLLLLFNVRIKIIKNKIYIYI